MATTLSPIPGLQDGPRAGPATRRTLPSGRSVVVHRPRGFDTPPWEIEGSGRLFRVRRVRRGNSAEYEYAKDTASRPLELTEEDAVALCGDAQRAAARSARSRRSAPIGAFAALGLSYFFPSSASTFLRELPAVFTAWRTFAGRTAGLLGLVSTSCFCAAGDLRPVLRTSTVCFCHRCLHWLKSRCLPGGRDSGSPSKPPRASWRSPQVAGVALIAGQAPRQIVPRADETPGGARAAGRCARAFSGRPQATPDEHLAVETLQAWTARSCA